MTEHRAQIYRVCIPSAPMRAAPQDDAECTNECLYGERVQMSPSQTDESNADQKLNNRVDGNLPLASDTDSAHKWIHVTAARDGYSGYMHTSQMQAIPKKAPVATHWVSARTTLVFQQPSIKSRVVYRLPFLSRVVSTESSDIKFHQLDTGAFIWSQHLLETGQCLDTSAIKLAQTHFLGAPYLWGGCSPNGLDCSGLIQALAQAKGIQIPRDSGDQEQALSNAIKIGQQQAQDIVYWPGHTGILLESTTLLHATAHSLSCVVEPLDDVVERAGAISSVKRIF